MLLHSHATSSRHVTSARLAQGRAPVGRCSSMNARRQTRDEFRQRCKRSCAPVCDDVSIAACAKRHTIQHSRCANWCDGTVLGAAGGGGASGVIRHCLQAHNQRKLWPFICRPTWESNQPNLRHEFLIKAASYEPVTICLTWRWYSSKHDN